MNKYPLVSIIILTYDRSDLLESCLNSVLKSNYPNLEYIVSDNGSQEDIAGFIKNKFKNKKIKVVRLNKNKGLTGGFNFGFKFCKGKYVLVLSNDTKIEKNTILDMVQLTEKDPEIGIVSPKIIQMKNPKYLHNAGSFITFSGLLYHYGILQKANKNQFNKNYYIFSCNGAGFLIRQETAKACGLFDEDFFYFYDDSDLSHRVWLSGYTIVYCAKAEIYHLWSGTMKGANPLIWYYNHRNHISSFMRNLSLPYLLFMLFNYNLFLFIWFFINIIKFKFDNAFTLFQAYFWHLSHFNETIKKRNIIQNKIRKVSDNKIFEKCMVNPGWNYYRMYLNLKNKDKSLPNRVLYSGNL